MNYLTSFSGNSIKLLFNRLFSSKEKLFLRSLMDSLNPGHVTASSSGNMEPIQRLVYLSTLPLRWQNDANLAIESMNEMFEWQPGYVGAGIVLRSKSPYFCNK